MKKATALITILVVLSSLMSQALAEPELKGSPAELAQYFSSQSPTKIPQTVTIRGEATVDVHAEKGIVILSVITKHERLQQALQTNQEIRQNVLKTLTGAGIPGEHIRESNLSSTPQYGFFGDKPQSYTVENILRITLESEKAFQEVAHLVDKFEEIYYREILFEYSRKAELRRQALALAYDDLAQKKNLYEEKLGMTLSLKTFSDGSVVESSPFTGVEQRAKGTYSRGNSGTEVPILTFGELVIVATVTVEYFIESQ